MHTQGARGFTLIELLITLSIAVTISALAIPNFLNILEKSSQRNAIYKVTILLQQARISAATTGYRTLICSIDEMETCLKSWTGKEIIVALDKNGNRKRDNDEPIIYRTKWDFPQIHLNWVTNALQDPSITYQPKGTVVANGTLSFIDDSDQVFARLKVNTGGRARLEKP